ncbi:unnamed protein product [Microthlaspi erraticum]|uniref:RING-type E3 ubiquitin transferase n=1 Tax=Microthlaspi erraticum TaxID=1685480 RepID=A0A6D2KND7_9BRAS|nr:unnamed protein product [Microthlaspi erraticum]
MRCNLTPPAETECFSCTTCGTPWHVSCLSSSPKTLESTQEWECPDCSGVVDPVPVSGIAGVGSSNGSDLEADESLTEAHKKQQLVSGKAGEDDDDEEEEKNAGENFFCSICEDLLERPVTTPCGHNFCLKCFQKWVALKKFECVKCCRLIPKKMANNPRINYSLLAAIRLAKVSKSAASRSNQNRPDQAFRTERAKKTNAASGKMYVTIPPDHLGPIPAEKDPIRNQGVLVGEFWADRLECRQWGAHFAHVAGIAGQADFGAQSVALSGGYADDEDHGEWFLYTGSGGKDLSGDKLLSCDQMFTKSNEALKLSCKMGYPVRVIRSHKDRSAYAPGEKGGKYKVYRYLFVRCDNESAPWTSDEHGDRPRDLPDIPELEKATDLFERKETETPSWGFDESEGRWNWMKAPPASRMAPRKNSVKDKLLETQVKKTWTLKMEKRNLR